MATTLAFMRRGSAMESSLRGMLARKSSNIAAGFKSSSKRQSRMNARARTLIFGAGAGTAISIYLMCSTNSAECASELVAAKSRKSADEGTAAGGGSGGAQDPVEKLIERFGPMIQKLGFGGVMGVCTGIAVKRLGYEVAYVAGLGFAALQMLAYYGYISIDFNKVVDDAKKVVDQDGDGQLTTKDAIAMWKEAKKILTFNLPGFGGFASGMALGLYYGN